MLSASVVIIRIRPDPRTRLEIPGWAGEREPRANGSREQVWHCVPFSEGAQYGIELFYPYDNELRVTKRKGRVVLDGDWGRDPKTGVNWPPFWRRASFSRATMRS